MSDVTELFPNCDAWGAAEWYQRMVDSVARYDKAVREGNDIQAATFKNIISSSAFRLAREFPAALSAAPPAQPVTDAAKTAREVFSGSCDHTRQAIDYMEQLLLAAPPAQNAAVDAEAEPVAFTVPYALEILRQGRGTTAPLCPTKAPDYHPLCTVPLYAAPPSDPVGQGAVTVKPLEWSDAWGTVKAETQIGHYFVEPGRDGSFNWRLENIHAGWASSEHEAKAAAQADYERRILSALSPAPEAEAICDICEKPLNPADLCAIDIELDICHAACLEGSPTVNLDTGDPMEGPIKTFRYSDFGGDR